MSSCKQIRKNPRCTFLECRIHLCDFHREKAWNEWLSKIDHGMSTRKDEVLGYLRSIASSASKVDLEKNTLAFKSSEVWKILLPYRSTTLNTGKYIKRYIMMYFTFKVPYSLDKNIDIFIKSAYITVPCKSRPSVVDNAKIHIFTSCLPCSNSSRDGVQAEAVFPSKVIKTFLNVKARLRLFYL